MELPKILRDKASDDPEILLGLTQLGFTSGEQFLHEVAAWLHKTLQVFAISIGDVGGKSAEELNVRAFSCDDLSLSPESYTLSGAPCLDAITSNQQRCIAENVVLEYPNDTFFIEHHIHSYVGMPLHNRNGRPIGILCCFDKNPIENTSEVAELLEWMSTRVSTELATIRQFQHLVKSSAWISQPSSADLFRDMLHLSTDAIQVASGFIAQWIDDDPDHYNVVAAVHSGETLKLDPFERYSFADSPCGLLKEQDRVIFPNNVLGLFPKAEMPMIFGATGYLGFTLTDHNGEAIGHIAWAHHNPLYPGLADEGPVHIYRDRANAELRRLRDEKERKDMANSLLAKHKLESLGLMAGAIAHDFNNLLVTILGNANLAMDHTNERGKAFLKTLETAGIKAGEIVKQLLTYAGERQGELQAIDLSYAVKNAHQLLELTKHDNVKIEYNLADELPTTLADHAQLQQIVINLVLNAVEALGDKKGTVYLSTKLTALTDNHIRQLIRGRDLSPGDYLTLEIEDNGIGMEEEIVERMFDPFFTNKAEGRGLGMAALQGFANAHRGGIGVISKPNVGTKISVYLRVAEHSAAHFDAQLANLSKRPQRSSLPVLVVDDEPGVRTITAKLLESLNYTAVTCDSGQEAVDLINDGAQYAMAIIDISMPGLNGWETLKMIRARVPELPAVMMSGYTEQLSGQEIAQDNHATFLAKPFRRIDLQDTVSQLVIHNQNH